MTGENSDSVIYACPGCAMQLQLSTEHYGMKVQCPGCSSKFVVEESPDGQNEVAPQADAHEETAEENAARKAQIEKAAVQEERAQQAEETKASSREATAQAAAREAAIRKAAQAAASDLEPVMDEMSTDVMMRDFKGQKVLFLLCVAVVVHFVVMVVSSFGYLRAELFLADTSELDKEARVNVAVGEATSALSEIVKRHNINIDDVLEKFSAVDSKSGSNTSEVKAEPVDDPSTDTTIAPVSTEPERKKTDFEKNLIEAQKGPDISLTDEDDDSGL